MNYTINEYKDYILKLTEFSENIKLIIDLGVQIDDIYVEYYDRSTKIIQSDAILCSIYYNNDVFKVSVYENVLFDLFVSNRVSAIYQIYTTTSFNEDFYKLNFYDYKNFSEEDLFMLSTELDDNNIQTYLMNLIFSDILNFDISLAAYHISTINSYAEKLKGLQNGGN